MEQKTNSTQYNIPNLCETDGIPFDEKQIHQIWKNTMFGKFLLRSNRVWSSFIPTGKSNDDLDKT